jgi:hypothetical protein
MGRHGQSRITKPLLWLKNRDPRTGVTSSDAPHDEDRRSHKTASSVAGWSPRKWDLAEKRPRSGIAPALRFQAGSTDIIGLVLDQRPQSDIFVGAVARKLPRPFEIPRLVSWDSSKEEENATGLTACSTAFLPVIGGRLSHAWFHSTEWVPTGPAKSSGQRARQPGIGIGAGCADQRHAAVSFAVRLLGNGPCDPIEMKSTFCHRRKSPGCSA